MVAHGPGFPKASQKYNNNSIVCLNIFSQFVHAVTAEFLWIFDHSVRPPHLISSPGHGFRRFAPRRVRRSHAILDDRRFSFSSRQRPQIARPLDLSLIQNCEPVNGHYSSLLRDRICSASSRLSLDGVLAAAPRSGPGAAIARNSRLRIPPAPGAIGRKRLIRGTSPATHGRALLATARFPLAGEGCGFFSAKGKLFRFGAAPGPSRLPRRSSVKRFPPGTPGDRGSEATGRIWQPQSQRMPLA
jgi:hypothetical protein